MSPGSTSSAAATRVGLRRRLMAPHGLVDTEPALEHVDHTRPVQLPPGDRQRVVGEREQPEAIFAERAGRGDLGWGGMWRTVGELEWV